MYMHKITCAGSFFEVKNSFLSPIHKHEIIVIIRNNKQIAT